MTWYGLSEPEIRIHGDQTDPPLSPPLVHPTLAPGGGITLPSAYQAPVVTFDSGGAVSFTAGRAGGGPGEWSPTGTGGVTWFADTLVVTERTPPRIHRFDPEGRGLGTRRIELPGEPAVTLLRALGGDRILAVLPPRGTGGGQRLVLADPEQGSADSLGIFQERFTHRVVWPDGSGAVGVRPIPEQIIEATDPGGTFVALVDRPAASTDAPSSWRLRILRSDGSVLIDSRVCYHPLPIPTRTLGDTVNVRVAMLSGAPGAAGVPHAEQVRIVESSLALPGFWPPVDRIVAAASGDVLLRRDIRLGTLAPWESRGPDGVLRGVILIPEDRWLIAAEGGDEGDAVWIEAHDEYGVPRLERSRLHQTSAPHVPP